MLTLVLVWACFGLSWNVLSGMTGLISFGHASFFGLGAYTTVLLANQFNVSPWLSLPLATLIGAAAGLIIGLPTFRLRGHYFALSMLAYPACDALRVRMARLPGGHASAEARERLGLHAVRRSPRLCDDRACDAPRHGLAHPLGRAHPLRHGADRDQAERGRRRGRRHRHAALEAARHRAERRHGRRHRLVLRRRPARRHAGLRVRHARARRRR